MSFPFFRPQTAVVHSFGYNKSAVEFTNTPEHLSPNVVILIGGLTNGLNGVSYIPQLAAKVASQGWTLIQIIFGSSYSGFGTGSLSQDARDIRKLVRYLRGELGGRRQKIVLSGFSTGCHDSMEYISNKWHEPGFDAPVEGAILQGPVSDVEAFGGDSQKNIIQLTEEVQRDYIDKGKEEYILPEKFRRVVFNTPITAYRFNSLLAPGGDDDYFSSYLNLEHYEKTFGRVHVPILVVYGGSDEYVPQRVDKEKLVARWKEATDPKFWSPLSRIIKGAKHDIGEGSAKGALDEFLEIVGEFLKSI